MKASIYRYAILFAALPAMLHAASPPVNTTSPLWKKHVVIEGAKTGINSALANDWNGDGKMDVIASFNKQVVVFSGPQWTPHVVHTFSAENSRRKLGSNCIHSCLIDVDQDGDMDFIGSNQVLFWLECPDNPLDGTPWIWHLIDDQLSGSHCVLPGDVNADGKMDLIANSFQTPDKTPFPYSIAWLEIPRNPRTAPVWIRHVFAGGDAPGGNHYMGMADVNKDGRPDIACGAKGGDKFPNGEWFAWWEQPEKGLLPWKKHLLADNQPGATNILPADLNGDGHMDWFASRGHGQGVLWFKGPHFTWTEIDPTIAFPHSLALADLDNDGDTDAVTCGSKTDGEAVWYENDGKAQFTRHTIARNQGSYDTRVIDMDGDGDLDVLIAGHGNKNIVWLEQP